MKHAALWLYLHIPIADKKEKSSAEDSGMGSKEQTDDTELSCMSKRGLVNNAQPRVKEKTKPGDKSITSPGGDSNQSSVLPGRQDVVGKKESPTSSRTGTIYFKNV